MTVTKVRELMKNRLNQIKSGEVSFNVSNQFDETIIKSALKSADEEIQKLIDEHPESIDNWFVMDFATHLSSFQAPGLDSAWVD